MARCTAPRTAALLGAAAAFIMTPSGARGQSTRPSPPLVWPTYSFSTFEYVATATFSAVAIDTALVSPRPSHFRGGVLFDDGARDVLRASSPSARKTALVVDDALVGVALAYPLIVDAVATAAVVRRSPTVAKEMALIDVDTLGLTAALHGLTSFLVSRERPRAQDCGTSLPNDASECRGAGRFRSFFSADAALTFASAGLVCSHHMNLGLLGGAADVMSCVGALVVAGAATALGVVGDAHYATDALTGVIVGSAVGFGVPFLHYAERRASEVDVHIVPSAGGASLAGTF